MKSIIPPSLYDDCRVILYETKRKVQGEWQIEKKRAFPGYVFLITSQINEVKTYLRQIPELTKVLGYDGEIVALSEDEEELIKRLSGSDEVIELSYGIQIGDKVTITEGPLMGMESIIRKIDRHKRRAIVEIMMLGMSREITVGLEIVTKVK